MVQRKFWEDSIMVQIRNVLDKTNLKFDTTLEYNFAS